MHHGKVTKEIAKSLLALHKRIEAAKPPIPSSKIDETLNIATWNIREFGKKARSEAFFKAITKHGLQIPKGLLGVEHGSNLEKDKRYDQILHHATYDNFCNYGGVLDFFIDEAHIKELFPANMTKEEFTYQMSDHLPLWIQIGTDIVGEQLQQIVRG